MIMKRAFLILLFAIAVCCAPKDETYVDSFPEIYPDYISVTVPCNIAPLNFDVKSEGRPYVSLSYGTHSLNSSVCGSTAMFPEKKWHKFLMMAAGDSIKVSVSAGNVRYKDFFIYVSETEIDPYLSYRKIAPGFEIHSKMGLYCRDLTSYKEKVVFENTAITGSCINCHSFNAGDPSQVTLHVRGTKGGTLIRDGKHSGFFNSNNGHTRGGCTYEAWHPSGKYIAYSTNIPLQMYHVKLDNRIEIYDKDSDISIFDCATEELFTSPTIADSASFETYPSFSRDGKTLFFARARMRPMPDEYDSARYNLCCTSFEDGKIGDEIRTLVDAEADSLSICTPRPSADGRYIMFAISSWGTFPIWHRDCQIGLYDMEKDSWRILDEVCSPETDSWHSWSNNGSGWFCFASRRDDGLHTRVYFSMINPDGSATKPFMLPQRRPDRYYTRLFYSYNIPELSSSEFTLNIDELTQDKKEIRQR